MVGRTSTSGKKPMPWKRDPSFEDFHAGVAIGISTRKPEPLNISIGAGGWRTDKHNIGQSMKISHDAFSITLCSIINQTENILFR